MKNLKGQMLAWSWLSYKKEKKDGIFAIFFFSQIKNINVYIYLNSWMKCFKRFCLHTYKFTHALQNFQKENPEMDFAATTCVPELSICTALLLSLIIINTHKIVYNSSSQFFLSFVLNQLNSVSSNSSRRDSKQRLITIQVTFLDIFSLFFFFPQWIVLLLNQYMMGIDCTLSDYGD